MFIEPHSNCFYIKDLFTKKILLHGTSRNGLYEIIGAVDEDVIQDRFSTNIKNGSLFLTITDKAIFVYN